MLDYAALKTELTTDPAGLGYTAPIAAGSDAGVADLINSIGSGSAYLLQLPSIDKNTFLTLTTPAAVRIGIGQTGADGSTPLSAAAIAKWTAVLAQGRAADPGSQINLALIATLGSPVADNVMTSAEFAALTTRQGSRAEVLFGAGTVVTSDDVATALRGA